VLKPGGLLLVHRPDEDPLPEAIGKLRSVDRRIFGRSIVEFYRKDEETA
jgi:16S rRNA (guanine966-N2)-methyltransferase